MKVVGTGAPRTLTVRVQPCEIAIWREALRRRMNIASDAALRGTPGAADGEAPDRGEVAVLARLLDRAHDSVSAGQPRMLTGPTWLLGDVVQEIARAAVDRYAEAWRTFEQRPDGPNADRLRIALDAMSAATATAIALARVQNDATD